MVKKASDKWKMCVNFINLNKASSKDSFPILTIDKLVDASVGHKVFIFMDAFLGYKPINMDLFDQKKQHSSSRKACTITK